MRRRSRGEAEGGRGASTRRGRGGGRGGSGTEVGERPGFVDGVWYRSGLGSSEARFEAGLRVEVGEDLEKRDAAKSASRFEERILGKRTKTHVPEPIPQINALPTLEDRVLADLGPGSAVLREKGKTDKTEGKSAPSSRSRLPCNTRSMIPSHS